MAEVTKNGSTDLNSIYLAIGYAVSKWEHLETRLFLLYSALAGNDYFADVQAYSAIVSFRGRTTTIERLATYRLHNSHRDLLKSCKAMLKRIERLSTRRNQVVHGQIANCSFSITDDTRTKNFSGLYLANSIYGTPINYDTKLKSYHYNHEEIIAFGNDFEKFRHDLNELVDQCIGCLPFENHSNPKIT